MTQKLPVERASRELAGAVDALLGHAAVTSSTTGAVGFCMGGGFVLSLAAQQGDRVSAAAPFYGLPKTDIDYSGLTARVQGHYGAQDQGVSPEAVRAEFERINRDSSAVTEVFTYDAGHAFVNDERPGYDEASARLAWQRMVDFCRTYVR